MRSAALLVAVALCAFGCRGEELFSRPEPTSDQPAFLNPDLPLDERLDDLVGRLTLEEKALQLTNTAPAIERLGIPAYNWWNEALHGVARSGLATVFPQAIGLAATWDDELMLRIAKAVSDEARAKYHEFQRRGKTDRFQGLTLWAPNVNLFRDPRWGRGMETYGEDPYLAGHMGAAFVRGLQGDDDRYLKTVATPKHFAVHSGPEAARHSFDATVTARDLQDTYLPQFRATVVEAKAASVMCAYNRVNAEPACGSPALLGGILRERWGFDGFVVSDCSAVRDFHAEHGHGLVADAAEASALALRSGCDLNCGRDYESLPEAVARGLVSEAEIDRAIKRVFGARFRLGMFDPNDRIPWSGLPLSIVASEAHAKTALEAARKSIVLLKNEAGNLPLPDRPQKIAVVGPLADDPYVLLGNYHGMPSRTVTVRAGLEAIAPAGSTVRFAPGSDVAEGLPVLTPVPESALRNLRGSYYANRSLSGEPVLTRDEQVLAFNWWDRAPAESLDGDRFSVRYRGELVVPASGRYTIGMRAQTGYAVFIDGERIKKRDEKPEPRLAHATVELLAERAYEIIVELTESANDASFELSWAVPRSQGELRTEAVALAARSDVVVAVMGLTPWLEGEEMKVEAPGFDGGDRTSLDLPKPQSELLRALHDTGKPVTLILMSGGALSIPWAQDHVASILHAWYPGQAGGTAVAEVIFGKVDPSGRLPVTFYESVDDLPPFTDYSAAGRTYRYFEGEPLYAFGHGLSYTRFAYQDLHVPSRMDTTASAHVEVVVENVGDRPGHEVVQLYVSAVETSPPGPLRSLRGFRRVYLQPDERTTLSFTLSPRDLSIVDEAGARVVEPGKRIVTLGSSQAAGDEATESDRVHGMIELVGARSVLDPG